MFIPNDPLAEIAIQNIVNANSARAAQTSFKTLFNSKYDKLLYNRL